MERLHSLDITPFEKTLTLSATTDEAYQFAPLNSPNVFASGIVETRFSGEVIGPYAAILRAVIKQRLDRTASEPSYWKQRAYPQLPGQGQLVRVAVWEPDGLDIGLFRHSETACLIVGPGVGCLVDPHIDGVDRSQAWAFVKGFHDLFSDETSPQAKAWQDWQAQRAKEIGQLALAPQRHAQLIQAMQQLGLATAELAEAQAKQHGTHVAGIVVQDNPFAEVVAIRDTLPLADDAAAFHRIRDFLRTNKVRVVNMSWGFAADRNPTADLAAFEEQMLKLFTAFPDTLFVAAAGNDDDAIDKHRFLPASLSAPNLLTVGAVDQDGQVTFFTNVGSHVALYANGDMVHSVGPTGYPLEMSGTSMAAPQVCNVAAKSLSQHPSLSVAELKHLLIDGADELLSGNQLPAPIKILNPAHSAALSGR
ncbi:MAG: S8 family serine peptidase [Pseudomonadota bacterium]|nr:S8 family serine peptidase [Pseudomonadota bacterium]